MLLWRLSTDRGSGGGGSSRGGGCGGREVNAVAESHHCFVVHGLTDHLKNGQVLLKALFMRCFLFWRERERGGMIMEGSTQGDLGFQACLLCYP